MNTYLTDLHIGSGRKVRIASLRHLSSVAGIDLYTIPYVGRIFLESLLRSGDVHTATTVAQRLARGEDAEVELDFRPARVLVQDFTGIPLLVDLAAVRDHVSACGSAPEAVNPAIPTDVVVDHAIQVDVAGVSDALSINEALEFQRNHERYSFLKWAQQAYSNLRVIPPGRGIVHQVNLEQLATAVACSDGIVFPDTVVGTDSHTTMVNGLGVLGWGIGGLEAEAIMLGLTQPMRMPRIVGVRLTGRVRSGVLATDLALALTSHLRSENVTGVVVEFTGPGVDLLSAPDRCTIANMAPEYGAMAAYFPIDVETLRYLRHTGRDEQLLELIDTYCSAQQLIRGPRSPEPVFGRTIQFDLSSVEASLAGPSNPHQRVGLASLAGSFHTLMPAARINKGELSDGDIVIAAITSCTNTSNPKAMLAAGLLARRAVERGLRVPRHVKTSLAPGSRAVTHYLQSSGLLADLETLGFHVVGYGCMTCNGGSGPLAPDIAEAIERDDLAVCAVLSGNRNFEGRIHGQVRAGYLASPPLVVALALAGHVRGNLERDPLGLDAEGGPVYLADLWPSDAELAQLEAEYIQPSIFSNASASSRWDAIEPLGGPLYTWDPQSTYVRRPPWLDGPTQTEAALMIRGARALAVLGDYVSTDHISPVGAIALDSPAGAYLRDRGVPPSSFNSYGARRGNHEVMLRGTFASTRLRNHVLDNVEGGYTLHLPTGECVTMFEAASRYARSATPLIVLAGKAYGIGSSRDWAAKGPWLLGVRAVIAESFERIHRANLCAMGILPLTFAPGQSWASLALTGRELFTLVSTDASPRQIRVLAERPDGSILTFAVDVQIHSQGEWDVLHAGGMAKYMVRRLAR